MKCSRVPLKHSPTSHDIAYGTVVTGAKHKADFIVTTDAPPLALTGELWGICYDDCEGNWLHCNSTELHKLCDWVYTYTKLLIGRDCSGEHYGHHASLGLPWSDQMCALLNGPVTGIRVWRMPSQDWLRGWVIGNRSLSTSISSLKFRAIFVC